MSPATPTRRASSTGGAKSRVLSVRLDLSRLRHQGVQRRHALRPVHPRTTRRRPARAAMRKNPATLAALGFLTLGDHFNGNMSDIINDRIDVTSKAFLGLTVTCARCHDHKFDPIPTADYYSLYGIFASSMEPCREAGDRARSERRATRIIWSSAARWTSASATMRDQNMKDCVRRLQAARARLSFRDDEWRQNEREAYRHEERRRSRSAAELVQITRGGGRAGRGDFRRLERHWRASPRRDSRSRRRACLANSIRGRTRGAM